MAVSRTRAALSLFCLALLALPVGGELYLRSVLHPPPDPERFPFAHPPLAELRVSIRRGLAEVAPRQVAFTTNALGLRGDDLDLDDRAKLRVLTLGDSVTECMLLSDQDAWPHQLQEQLARRLGRPVWVGNAAKSGEMVSDYAAHMRLLAPQIAPDLVVIVAGGHDFQSALEEGLIPVTFEQPGQLETFRRKGAICTRERISNRSARLT
jgi:lysophospholipase L1-like esterase